MKPIGILQINENRPRALRQLERHFEVHRLNGDALRNLPALAIASGIRGLATGVPPVPITAALMDRLPDLEIIANFGVGYDAVDVEAAIERRIVVTHTPGVVDEEVADLAFGLLLATVRRLPQAHNFVTSGRWQHEEFPMSPTLRGRRIGLVGMGRIGQAIARRCGAFGLEVLYHARRRRADCPHEYVPKLVDLATAADVLITVTPGGAETRGLIGAAVLAALGPQGVLINVGRGTVVDEQALIHALETGAILAAGLDVFADEPNVPQAFLVQDNVVLLPHVGGATDHTRDLIGDLVVRNLVSWFAGKGAVTAVPEASA